MNAGAFQPEEGHGAIPEKAAAGFPSAAQRPPVRRRRAGLLPRLAAASAFAFLVAVIVGIV